MLSLPFKDEIKRPDRDNAIDVYLSEDYEDVIGDGIGSSFSQKSLSRSPEKSREYLAGLKGVVLGSDAFFPFETYRKGGQERSNIHSSAGRFHQRR